MCQGVTRRELLRKGGTLAAVGTAGCFSKNLKSMHRTLRAEDSTILEPTETESSLTIETEWNTRLDLEGTEIWVQDAVELGSGGTLLGGSTDGRPFLARLSADGEIKWTRIHSSRSEDAAFESLTRLPTGDVVAAGWSGWNGFVARYTTTGESMWHRTLSPGPDDFQFRHVCQERGDRVLVVGERTGKNDGDHRNSAWLVRMTVEGGVDWHRFYGGEIGLVNNIVVSSQNRYLLNVWKQTNEIGVRQAYDSVIAITNGVQAWEHVYPGINIDSLGIWNQQQYYVSGTGGAVSSFELPESIALVGLREFGGPSTWYRKLSAVQEEVIGSLSVPVKEGLLTVYNTSKSHPLASLITWDGSVSNLNSLGAGRMVYMRRVSSRSFLLITESNVMTKLGVNESQ